MATFTQYTVEALRAMVDDGVGESQHVEFKRDFPLDAAEARRTLAADATAMANGGGGAIIVGIDNAGALHPRADSPGFTERVVQSIAAMTEPRLDVRVERHKLDDFVVHVIDVPSRSSRPVSVPANTKRPEWIVPIRRSQTTSYMTFSEVIERVVAGQGTRLRLRAGAARIHAALESAVKQLEDSTHKSNPAHLSARDRYRRACVRAREAIEALIYELQLVPATDHTRPITAVTHPVRNAFERATDELEQIEYNMEGPYAPEAWDASRVRERWETHRRDIDAALSRLDEATREVFGPDQ